MLHGAQIKDADAYESLLRETVGFFREIKEFFEREVRLLKGPARAETRFVTAYIDEVALENINKAITNLEKNEAKSSKLPQKVLHYLVRAQEFLAKTTQNNIDGAQFIPVDFHRKIAEQDKALLTKCNSLIESARKIIESAPENNKTWLSLYVNLANMLPDVRAAGFGLDLPQERGAALERLMAIEKDLVALQSNSNKALITNASKRKLGCDSFDSVPLQAEFNEYVPSLIPVFDSFKRMMQSDKAALTKEVVHAAVATEYPKPALK